ncbi:MAG TPA: hypothetical protein DCE41_06345 [Cytophagales bacterium]|nr:hypothetical protein [Cytophagales bacterium]HAA19558.1 hypothetical protein [Cytophagales bacterium]HAP63190.1 hypothetical protein [Cytophagales bacterium]
MFNSVRFGLASRPDVAFRSNTLLKISKYRILLKLLLIVVPVVYVYVYSLFNNVVEGVIPFIVIFCMLMIPELLLGLQHWGHEMRQTFSYDVQSKLFYYKRGKVEFTFAAEDMHSVEWFCPIDKKGAMRRFQYLTMVVKGQRISVSNLRFSLADLLGQAEVNAKLVRVALPLMPAIESNAMAINRNTPSFRIGNETKKAA